MSCNGDRFINRTGQVMGEFGTVRIALRGPGCINGTGRCNVAGARGRCTNVFGTGDDIKDNVMGTGGSSREKFVNDVLEAVERRTSNNVMGSNRRKKERMHCCDFIWSHLETPITIPR